ncbi:hypothetical protein L3Q82_025812, partial [Scortum barcoo]
EKGRVRGGTMYSVRQFLGGAAELDNRAAAMLTGAGALVAVTATAVAVRRVRIRREAEGKIRRARERRAESLRRAEQAVLRYRESHPATDSALICTLSLSELTKKLQEGLLSPEDVFYSYVEKALDVHTKLNCCTGILLESFDQLKTVSSNKEGLLYGVPVSIKENIGYKNHDSSCGVVINLEQPEQEDSVLVKVLKRQGAIPFTKTNLPQALLNYDCSNPIYGQTLNPYNLKKTSGGSSGGEGALIGGGGSVLGIGSDIGGSIRIPASFCGICGFKATSGRLSSKGVKPIYRGQKSGKLQLYIIAYIRHISNDTCSYFLFLIILVLASCGPMARDVDSLALFMQAVLCDDLFSLDPTVPPLPFNMQIYQSSKPLRIGYLENDGYTQPVPSMVRSIREVKALLEQAGHTLVPYSPLKIAYAATELMMKGVIADGGTSMLEKLKGSPLDPCLKDQVLPYSLPKWLKKTISFLIKPLVSSLLLSIQDLWKQHANVEDYIHETIAEWRRCNIDVLLCPMFGPAYNFLYCGKTNHVLSCTMTYNLLNFPVGVVPVSTVTAEDEKELRHYKGTYQDFLDRNLKEAVTGGEGLPVAVQCVALPWKDELCLRFMKEVEQLVKQSRK